MTPLIAQQPPATHDSAISPSFLLLTFFYLPSGGLSSFRVVVVRLEG